MATQSRTYLKNKFITGYKPTQSDYADLFDSYYNINDDQVDLKYTDPSNIQTPNPGNIKLFIDSNNNRPFLKYSNGDVSPLKTDYQNPVEFYLDSSVDVDGDGTLESPFKTLTSLNNKILSLPTNRVYIGIVAPSDAGYGSEVVGELNIAFNLSLVGTTPQNTGIGCDIKLEAPIGSSGIVNQYRNVALNGIFSIDLTNASFASISFQNGAFNINRIDNNPSGFISLTGGISNTTVGGTIIMQGGVLFGVVTVNPGSKLYVSDLLNLGGSFDLYGNCELKTLSFLNPSPNYVNGTTDGSGTPTWYTDAPSDEIFSGTVTKVVY